jgi:large subunit ribosomal protein L6
MSRIGKSPITLPDGVTLTSEAGVVVVKGPKGEMRVPIVSGVGVEVKDTQVLVSTTDVSARGSSLHGTMRTLVNNALVGVHQGWSRTLELVGVGYRAQTTGKELNLQIGFSHPVKCSAPEGIIFAVADNTKITVSGIDKKMVGEVAAKLRSLKPPEPYKGKGIRYLGEKVRKKAGKAVKAAGAA